MRARLGFGSPVALGAVCCAAALALAWAGGEDASSGASTRLVPSGSPEAGMAPVVTDLPPEEVAGEVATEQEVPALELGPPAAAPDPVEVVLPQVPALPAAALEQTVVAAPVAELADALLEDMNAARAAEGLAQLAPSNDLARVAMARAQDLAERDYFDHYAPDGSSAFTELAARGIAYTIAGENLARNNYPYAQTEAVAFEALMASPGHRANILEPRFAQAGVAAVNAGTYWLYVTVFMN